MRVEYDGVGYEVELVDDGTLDTVILVNGIIEARFSQEYAAEFRDPHTGTLTAAGIEALGVEAIEVAALEGVGVDA